MIRRNIVIILSLAIISTLLLGCNNKEMSNINTKNQSQEEIKENDGME